MILYGRIEEGVSYVGCIDEVKVFDAALSAAEVHEQVMPATPSAGPPRRQTPPTICISHWLCQATLAGDAILKGGVVRGWQRS